MTTALGTLAAVAVIAVGFAAIDRPLATLDEPDAPTADVADAATASGESMLEFESVKGTVGVTRDVQFGLDGTLYALSTAPGERGDDTADGTPPEGALWSSTDGGETWANTGFGGLATDLWAQDMAVSDTGLYVVGTAPPTADSGVATVRVGHSDDGGDSWAPTDLTLAATPPVGMGDVVGQSTTAKVASSPSATVVVADTSFWLDASSLVPEDVRDAATEESYPEVTESGLALYDWSRAEELEMACAEARGMVDESGTVTTSVEAEAAIVDDAPAECQELEAMEPEVAWEASWEELGVDPQPLRYTEAFVSTGDGFSPVAFPDGIGDVRSVTWLDGAFYAVAGAEPISSELRFDPTVAQVLRSTDGLEWETVGEIDFGNAWISRIGSIGGRLMTVAEGGEGSDMLVSDDGGETWQQIDLASALPENASPNAWISAWDAGDLGAVVAITSYADDDATPRTYLLESTDLETWSVSEPNITYSDAIAVGSDSVWINGGAWTPSAHTHLVGTPAG